MAKEQNVEGDSISRERQRFRLYLRTGRRRLPDDDIELKFNPYHDPKDGRFTFGPGGASNAK
jgi:hypothetical protein